MNLGPHPIGNKTWCEEIRAGLFSQHPMPWSRDPLSGSRIVSIAEVGGGNAPRIPDSLDTSGTQCPCLVPEDIHQQALGGWSTHQETSA